MKRIVGIISLVAAAGLSAPMTQAESPKVVMKNEPSHITEIKNLKKMVETAGEVFDLEIGGGSTAFGGGGGKLPRRVVAMYRVTHKPDKLHPFMGAFSIKAAEFLTEAGAKGAATPSHLGGGHFWAESGHPVENRNREKRALTEFILDYKRDGLTGFFTVSALSASQTVSHVSVVWYEHAEVAEAVKRVRVKARKVTIPKKKPAEAKPNGSPLRLDVPKR